MNYYISSAQMTTESPEIGNAVMHSHDVYEIYLFLEGKADYLVEGNKYRLRKGDVMLMRRGELHINSIRGEGTYRRMYVNFDITELLAETGNLALLDMFDKRSLGEYNHYSAKEFPENHWQELLQAICSSTDKAEKLCYLLPLLQELNHNFSVLSLSSAGSGHNIVAEICRYINADLSQDLSLEHLARYRRFSRMYCPAVVPTLVLNSLFKWVLLR